MAMYRKLVTYLSFIFITVLGTPCNRPILLRPTLEKPIYRQWSNVTTTLICPAGGSNISVWYSSKVIYNMTLGCQFQNESQLNLPWFPDVPEITALIRTYPAGGQITCKFSLVYGILKAEMFGNVRLVLHNDRVSLFIYVKPNHSFTNDLYICRDSEVRNATCRAQDIGGTYVSGNVKIRTLKSAYRMTETIEVKNLIKYECYANIVPTYQFIMVNFKDDVDECTEASKQAKSLCKRSKCIDLWPGYRCLDNDYVGNSLCKTNPDWFCPNQANYAHMRSGDRCAENPCVEAANLGVQLCHAGYRDCLHDHQNDRIRCRRGIPLLDACRSMSSEASNWSCPEMPSDSQLLHDNVVGIAHSVQTLYSSDPDLASSLLLNLTEEKVNEDLEEMSELDLERMGMNLVRGMNSILNPVAISPIHHHPITGETVDSSITRHPVSPTKKLETIASMFHLFAVIARKTPNIRRRLLLGEADGQGLKFWHPNRELQTINLNISDGNLISIDFFTNDSASDVLGAMLTSQKLQGTVPDELKTEPMLDSDVVLIDSISAGSMYGVTVEKAQPSKNSPTCQQLSSAQKMWSPEHCTTVVVNSTYKCQCTPKTAGTFAMALVYWLGNAKIPVAHLHVISAVNYVFALITIIALLLFLLFTRFIGVFRLDQFNIAFCLMLSAIVSLPVPHVSDAQPIACTIVAVSVCFFPLAAFCWKLIFGLNTLVLIVAPHSRYHDMVSRQQHSFSLVWIGYIIPAIIIGAWFGYTGKVHTQNLCIGPEALRWLFIGPITAVVFFNIIILIVVGIVLLRSFLLTRKSRLNRGTHFLVLTQLMLTLGIPYVVIYIQLLDLYSMLITVPVAMAFTAILMFMLVAVIDEENRCRLCSFLRTHFSRTTSALSTGQLSLGVSQTQKSHSASDRKYMSASRSDDKGYRITELISSFDEIALANHPANHHTTRSINDQFLIGTASEATFEPGWLHQHSFPDRKFKQCPLVDPEDMDQPSCVNQKQSNGNSKSSGENTSPLHAN